MSAQDAPEITPGNEEAGPDSDAGAQLDYRQVKKCRVCGSSQLTSVMNLGEQALTGRFPSTPTEHIATGPLELLFCPECTLVQLGHEYNADQLYGDHYGYRSGLNKSMVRHLKDKIGVLERAAKLTEGDWVLDIGSNDGTTLGSYQTAGINRIGIDPTAHKFRKYYAEGIQVVEDFFTAAPYLATADGRPAKLITSMAMFYDLDAPVDFVRDVKACLAPDGLWHFEQSYLSAMLHTNSLDTICHEHVSYYSFNAIEEILRRAGMRVVDVSFNDVNGGSFAVTATHEESGIEGNLPVIDWVRATEETLGIKTEEPLKEFAKRAKTQVDLLVNLLDRLNAAGRKVVGYGASTKGNVLLQYAGIKADKLPAIGEINPDKYGYVTPGTHIPIVSDEEARAMNPDYFLVLPWHFRADILSRSREQEFLRDGGHFIFPLPTPEIV